MGPSTEIIAVVAFFCGVVVGGVAVAMQRAAAIERIKRRFQAELEAVLSERQSAETKPGSGYDTGRVA